MKKYIIFSIFILVTSSLFVSCSESDFYLQQSIFIEDPQNPGLPIYSEWGYNTFGVLVDRQPFTSTHRQMPAKIIVYPDTLNLILAGERNRVRTVLTFSFIGYAPREYSDLIMLNGETIDLTDREKSLVTITEGSPPNEITTELMPFNGEFTFTRVQNLFVDNELDKAIISGRFRFQTQYRNEYITFDRGRFDFTIGFDNFFHIAQ
jgi:hypothetical protein